MRKHATVICLALGGAGMALGLARGASADQAAQDVIGKVDANQVFVTESFKASMTIARGSQRITKRFYGFGKHEGKKSFMEFTNAEDKGVKYLKIGDELWIYFPDADDVMKISGHMLRQGMMGSDLSYEDMLENDKLEEKYASRLLAEKTVQDRPCYTVELTAAKPDVTYERQVIYVDKERYVPLELELYARGGRLLKTMSQTEVRRIGNRYVPMRAVIRDLRKKNSETTIIFESLEFDQPVPEKAFTRAYLKR